MPLWILDVNGVLIDSTEVVRQAFAATALRHGFAFTPYHFDAVKGLTLLDAYAILHPADDRWRLRTFHLGYVRERLGEVRAYPGVYETLGMAKRAGVRVGAATSHGEIAEACLVHADLYRLIDCLVTQEEVKRPKPDPHAILRVLSLLEGPRGGGASAAVYVGDTTADVAAGKAAGIRTVGVTYGVSTAAEISSARPDYIIHAFEEMQFLLEAAPTGASARLHSPRP